MNAGEDFISIEDPSKSDLLAILNHAYLYEQEGIPNNLLSGSVIGSLFFEGSTRTRLSFESAIQRLGAGVIGFSNTEGLSLVEKGESFEDTIRMVDGYVEAMVIRHPQAGYAQLTADIAQHPVINAGDGPNEHPTQTLIDLYAIQQSQGSLEDLTVGIVGDLKYGRVPHSLAKALSHFPSTKQIWVAPEMLKMPKDIKGFVSQRGVGVTETERIEDCIGEIDILYMTRVQEERFKKKKDYSKVKDIYVLNLEMLKNAKENMKILHALPRRYEIPEEIDSSDHAYYFQQARNGVRVRASLLAHVLGKVR